MTTLRLAFAVLGLALAPLALRGHEPFLLLTAGPDGALLVETGFSDGASPEGLKLLVRDRGTGEVTAEHTLPSSGKLTLAIPAAPYRVVFDAGPGHRVSKPGPERPAEGAGGAAAGPTTVSADATPGSASPAGRIGATQPPSTAGATVPLQSPAATALGSEAVRVWLATGIFFLFGTAAFGLGYLAGRKSR